MMAAFLLAARMNGVWDECTTKMHLGSNLDWWSQWWSEWGVGQVQVCACLRRKQVLLCMLWLHGPYVLQACLIWPTSLKVAWFVCFASMLILAEV